MRCDCLSRPSSARRYIAFAFMFCALLLTVFSRQAVPAEKTAAPAPASAPSPFVVTAAKVLDRKAVFATVRSTDKVNARARISGSIGDLAVDEGSQVKEGEVIATVGDPKLVLRLKSLDARIEGLTSRVANAETELKRAEKLIERGVATAQRTDRLRTELNVARTTLRSVKADRSVIERQLEEGAVLAPASGRVLSVAVTEGAYVMPGENIASIAANRYIVRLELPERHARFIEKGAEISVGKRGLGTEAAPVGTGRVVQVYPELQNGRVVADAEVNGIGDYFVGERALVWVGVGTRETIVIPRAFVFTRFGIDYVRLDSAEGPATDVVVQLGRPVRIDTIADGVEVLAGLRPGDRLVMP